MIFRALAFAAVFSAATGAAHAQVLDAFDPAVTERPRPDLNMRAPSYPNDGTRYNQQGEVVLVVCVDVTGKVVGADMTKSSGYPALDEATMNWIRSSPKFVPARAGDKPVAVCNYVFTYVWSLSGRTPHDPMADYLAWDDIKAEDRPSIAAQVNGPIYPPVAAAKRIAGPVRLSLCITPFGRVASATAIEGDTQSGLVRATSSWIGRFTFNPGKKDGKPVGVCGFPIKYDWALPN